jgi:hypothetical protein
MDVISRTLSRCNNTTNTELDAHKEGELKVYENEG